jgi:hypothetical protein
LGAPCMWFRVPALLWMTSFKLSQAERRNALSRPIKSVSALTDLV